MGREGTMETQEKGRLRKVLQSRGNVDYFVQRRGQNQPFFKKEGKSKKMKAKVRKRPQGLAVSPQLGQDTERGDAPGTHQ